MSWRRDALAGRSKVSRRSKRPGRSSAGSSESARLVAATMSTFGFGGRGLGIWRVRGQHPVDHVGEAPGDLLAAGRLLEGLHLHEQLVDDALGAADQDVAVTHQAGSGSSAEARRARHAAHAARERRRWRRSPR